MSWFDNCLVIVDQVLMLIHVIHAHFFYEAGRFCIILPILSSRHAPSTLAMVVVEFQGVSVVYLYNHNNGGPQDYWTFEFAELKAFAFSCIALSCVLHLL